MNLFADSVIKPMAASTDVPIDLSAGRQRARQFDEIVFPEGLPQNVKQLLGLARVSFVAGSDWHCIVSCRTVVERAFEYLSWYQEFTLGTRQNTSMKEMMDHAYGFALITEGARDVSLRIWREGSDLVHGQLVPTTPAIHLLKGLSRVLHEIAPHLTALPSRHARRT